MSPEGSIGSLSQMELDRALKVPSAAPSPGASQVPTVILGCGGGWLPSCEHLASVLDISEKAGRSDFPEEWGRDESGVGRRWRGREVPE